MRFLNHKLILIIITIAMVSLVGACGDAGSDRTNGAEPTQQPTSTQPAVAPVAPADTPVPPPISIVATSNIVADWTKQVGGERVEVFSLLPAGADPHTFQPGARDIARVADADLVLAVGLGMEAGWLQELVSNAAGGADSVVELGEAEAIAPIPFAFTGTHHEEEGHEEGEEEVEEEHEEGEVGEDEEEEHEEGEDEEDDHGMYDPHFWFDPTRVKRAVNDIAARLAVMEPESGDYFRANAAAYGVELDALDAWVVEQIDSIPVERRKLVTSHDSFGYLADRYDLEILGVTLPGGGTDREPSAKEVAELIEHLEEAGAPALFTETTASDKMSQQIVAETGAKFGGELYTGSLSDPGGDADTYIALIRYDISIIAEALR